MGAMGYLKSYIKDESGNFAMMFGIAATVIVMGAAVTVDTMGVHSYKSDLQNNLDAAALAVAAGYVDKDDNDNDNDDDDDDDDNNSLNAKYRKAIKDILIDNGFDLKGRTLDVSVQDGVLSVSARVPYDMKFAGVFKKTATEVAANTQVSLKDGIGKTAEIVLVLDNTESMNFNGKMTALKDGAKEFITAVEDSESDSKIALVPFARYVDIGEDKRGEPWLDVPAEFDTPRTYQQATFTGGTCQIETRTRYNDGVQQTYETEVCTGQTVTYEETSTIIESRWKGCVGARSNGLHLVDENYNTISTKIPGLLHRNPYEVTGYGWDEESWCPHTVSALTDDYEYLRNQINWLYGTDRTYIPMGLIWGQRILSPEAPFTEADSSGNTHQIMVLMSDGRNTAFLQDDGEHESLPHIQDLNSTQQENGTEPPGTNEDTATLCENIKNDGIEIYTIAFQVDAVSTKELLENCASSPGHYYDAGSNAALIQTFSSISENLEGESEVRLIK